MTKRFALIGCGRVSTRHVDAICKTPGASLVAVCDVDESRAKAYAEQLGIRAFDSTRALYQWGEFDLADIATPSGDHYERVLEAVAHGKHVVVEKPAALRLSHLDKMEEEARKAGRLVWVAFQNRYNPAVRFAKEHCGAERLGKPVVATVRVRWCRDQSYYSSDNWHGTWAMDGGVLSQQAIHHLDALQWVYGPIESVQALCTTRLVKMECEDLAVATVRFENGALGVIEAMTAARPKDFEASVSFLGDKSTLVLGGIAMNKVDAFASNPPLPQDSEVPAQHSQEIPNAYGLGHDVLYQRVVRSLEDRGPVEIGLSEAKPSLALLHALYVSNEEQRPVRLSELKESRYLGVKN